MLAALIIGIVIESVSFKSRDRNIPVKIITATDIHYLSPSLTDYGSIFRETINSSRWQGYSVYR